MVSTGKSNMIECIFSLILLYSRLYYAKYLTLVIIHCSLHQIQIGGAICYIKGKRIVNLTSTVLQTQVLLSLLKTLCPQFDMCFTMA